MSWKLTLALTKEKLILQLTFDPGLASTDFLATRPKGVLARSLSNNDPQPPLVGGFTL